MFFRSSRQTGVAIGLAALDALQAKVMVADQHLTMVYINA